MDADGIRACLTTSNYIRALELLHRMSLEQRGWKAFFRRWRYPHEPLRNDAANLVSEIGYEPGHPRDSKPLRP